MPHQTKCRYRTLLIAASVALTCSNAALASGPVIVTNFAENYGAINAGTASAATTVVTAVDMVTQAVSALQQAIATSSGNIADANNAMSLSNQKQMVLLKNKINEQPPPNTCGTRAIAQYAGSIASSAQTAGGSIAAAQHINAKVAPSPEVQRAAITNTHATKYCDGNTDPDCPAGTTPSMTNHNGQPLVNADTQASSLFIGAGDDTTGAHKPAATYDQNQMSAGQDYLANLGVGGDAPPRLETTVANSPGGKQYEGLRLAYEARVGLGQSVLSDILASRSPIPNSSALLTAMTNNNGGIVGSGQWLNNRIQELKSISSGNISSAELMKLNVEKRYANPDWYKAVNETAGDVPLLKELNYQMATMIEIDYQRYQMEEKNAAISAENLIVATKNDMLPKLDAAKSFAEKGYFGGGGR